MARWKKIAVWGLALSCLTYFGLVALLYSQQRRLLFPAPSYYRPPAAAGMANMAEIRIRSDDNLLTAWYGGPKDGCRSAVMVFHGNGSAVYSNTDIFRDLMNAGYGVWSVAYPGYPGSEGFASQDNLVKAAQVQADELSTRMGPDARIHYYGTSLGSGVAAQLSVTHPPDTLFLDAPFYSVVDLAAANMRGFPIRRMMRDTFKSFEALSISDVPLYWTHGEADRVVPISEGQRLFDTYTGPKSKLIIPNGNHVNLWALGAKNWTLSALAGTETKVGAMAENISPAPSCPG